jgi:hypothetical protein
MFQKEGKQYKGYSLDICLAVGETGKSWCSGNGGSGGKSGGGADRKKMER